MDTISKPVHGIGVVLAGGQSSRMGRDKALLQWRGRPLIEHQIDRLKAAGMQAVHISGERPDYQGIADPIAHAGPLGGIAGIAAACGDAELLIVPVDMPRLEAGLLQRLFTAPSPSGSTCFAGHVLPMRLRLDTACRAALAELMATDERARSLRALQERVGLSTLSLSDGEEAQLIDCNTEQSWREVCE